jgi:hypothetical protein
MLGVAVAHAHLQRDQLRAGATSRIHQTGDHQGSQPPAAKIRVNRHVDDVRLIAHEPVAAVGHHGWRRGVVAPGPHHPVGGQFVAQQLVAKGAARPRVGEALLLQRADGIDVGLGHRREDKFCC